MLVATAVCSVAAHVQSTTGTKGDLSEAVAKLEKVSAQLQLTPAQKEQVKPILMEELPKMRALKSNTTMPPLSESQADERNRR
jgi:hypothetical protein